MHIKLNYTRVCIHRRPYKFTYESTSAGKKIGKKERLAMARVNRNIHSTPITPTVSIPIHLPPVAGSQFAMCLKECSVCVAPTPQRAVLPRCPLGPRWQTIWQRPAGVGSSIYMSGATWKRLLFFCLYRVLWVFSLNWFWTEALAVRERVQLWDLSSRGQWHRES